MDISFTILSQEASAHFCDQYRKSPICGAESDSFKQADNIKQIQSISQKLSEDNFRRGNSCFLGNRSHFDLKSQMDLEANRLAPLLQKLKSIRQARGQKPENVIEVERIEDLLTRSSLFALGDNAEKINKSLIKEPVWNPKVLNKDFVKERDEFLKETDSNKFLNRIEAEMASSAVIPEQCTTQDPKLKMFRDSAMRDSFRTYQFKMILTERFSADKIQEQFDSCPLDTSTKEKCSAKAEDFKNFLEAETNQMICVIQKLYPQVGSQLNNVSVAIPSAAGDLVTDGPGERPTVAEATSDKFKFNFICPEDLSLGGITRGALGAGASFLTHELAHEGTATLLGQDLKWNSKKGTWSCPNCGDDKKPVAIAGLLSHNLSSEYLVRNQNNDSQFQKGWLFFNIFNSGLYFGRDWLARAGKTSSESFATGKVDKKGAGDLRTFSKKESYILGTLMIGHQLYSGNRYLQNRQNHNCEKKW